jgi:hypothetical protein
VRLAAIDIDWGALWEAAYVSAAFAIGVMGVAGLAVVASLKSQDRRQAHQGGYVALDVVTGAGVLVIVAAIALGIYIMTDK